MLFQHMIIGCSVLVVRTLIDLVLPVPGILTFSKLNFFSLQNIKYNETVYGNIVVEISYSLLHLQLFRFWTFFIIHNVIKKKSMIWKDILYCFSPSNLIMTKILYQKCLLRAWFLHCIFFRCMWRDTLGCPSSKKQKYYMNIYDYL